MEIDESNAIRELYNAEHFEHLLEADTWSPSTFQICKDQKDFCRAIGIDLYHGQYLHNYKITIKWAEWPKH